MSTLRTAGTRGHHLGAHRGGGVRRAALDPAHRDPKRRARRTHRGGGGGAALHHAPPRPARHHRPRHRPPQVAGPAAGLVSLAADLGEVGPHAEPPPGAGARLRRRGDRGADAAGLLDQDRAAVAPLVAQGRPKRARGSTRSRAWVWPGSFSRCACWCSCPKGRSAVEATSLRGLMTLRDSLRADPRVREVRSLVDLEPQRLTARLLGALQRPRGGRTPSTATSSTRISAATDGWR